MIWWNGMNIRDDDTERIYEIMIYIWHRIMSWIYEMILRDDDMKWNMRWWYEWWYEITIGDDDMFIWDDVKGLWYKMIIRYDDMKSFTSRHIVLTFISQRGYTSQGIAYFFRIFLRQAVHDAGLMLTRCDDFCDIIYDGLGFLLSHRVRKVWSVKTLLMNERITHSYALYAFGMMVRDGHMR